MRKLHSNKNTNKLIATKGSRMYIYTYLAVVAALLFAVLLISCDPPKADGGGSDNTNNNTDTNSDTGNTPFAPTTVSLVAGSGTAGYADGKGAAAQFNVPLGMAIDSDGTIYVADSANQRIRKITLDNTVTTYAGDGTVGNTTEDLATTRTNSDGDLLAAKFYYPTDVLIVSDTIMYVMDGIGLREINRSTNKVRTIDVSDVGNLNAAQTRSLRGGIPMGISSPLPNYIYLRSIIRHPTNGNYYLLDSNDYNTGSQNAIIEYDVTASTFFALNDISSVTYPKAADGSSILGTGDGFSDGAFYKEYLYVSSLDSCARIFRFDISKRKSDGVLEDGSVEVFVGHESCSFVGLADRIGSKARFRGVNGMIIRNDIMYVADTYNNRIRTVGMETLRVSTLTGTGTETGADTGNHINGPLATAAFRNPRDVEFAPNGDLIVSDHHSIRRIK